MSHAEPGMVLSMPVFHPQSPSTVLLKTEVELERATIGRLREVGVPEIWIRYPSLEMVSKFVSPRIQTARAEVANEVADAFQAASDDGHARLEFKSYKTAMRKLMQRLIDDKDASLFMGELVDAGTPAVRHGANVGFISMLMGLRLGFYLNRERSRLPGMLARDVTNLGVAAMLHDIGMTRLPDEVRERWRETRDTSDPEWQDHTRIGFEMLRGNLEPSAASAVLHHHQRWDGTGFPERRSISGESTPVSGHGIHIFARIIATADMYDRFVNPASDPEDDATETPSHPPVRALKRILSQPWIDWLDPIVVRGLISVCPAYPPGTSIRLNNGKRGAVTDWDARNPCRPTVRTETHFEDEDGEIVNLVDREELTIVEWDGVDVRADNFYPRTPTDFDLTHTERIMHNGAYALLNDQPAQDAPAQDHRKAS